MTHLQVNGVEIKLSEPIWEMLCRHAIANDRCIEREIIRVVRRGLETELGRVRVKNFFEKCKAGEIEYRGLTSYWDVVE